jgi:hypothetical protein
MMSDSSPVMLNELRRMGKMWRTRRMPQNARVYFIQRPLYTLFIIVIIRVVKDNGQWPSYFVAILVHVFEIGKVAESVQ